MKTKSQQEVYIKILCETLVLPLGLWGLVSIAVYKLCLSTIKYFRRHTTKVLHLEIQPFTCELRLDHGTNCLFGLQFDFQDRPGVPIFLFEFVSD